MNETDIDTDGDGIPDVTEQTNGTLYWHPADGYAFGPSTLGTPTDIGAYTNSSTITFSWTASTDSRHNVAGYNCQIGTTPGGTDVFNGYSGSVPSRTVSGCSNGKTYYCCVQANNNAGNWSATSGSSNGITVVANAGVSISAARRLPDSATVGLSGKIVTSIFGDCLYIEEPNRTADIRVVVPTVPSGIVIGSMVDVGRTLMTNASRERYKATGAIEAGVAH